MDTNLKTELKGILETQKLSQANLARAVNRTPAFINIVINRNYDLKLSDALRIAEALDVSIHDIWSLNGHERT